MPKFFQHPATAALSACACRCENRADPHGTTLSVKAPDAARIDILPFPKKSWGAIVPSPSRGRLGWGWVISPHSTPSPHPATRYWRSQPFAGAGVRRPFPPRLLRNAVSWPPPYTTGVIKLPLRAANHAYSVRRSAGVVHPPPASG